jgi:putative NADH-flavin reductase
MKLAIIGITGRAGSRIAREALARGHQVTGIARNPDPAKAPAGVTLWKGDANEPAKLAILRGHDALVAAGYSRDIPAANLAAIARGADISRLFVVGGAASLEIAPGKILLDSPDFPEIYKPEAKGSHAVLNDLKAIEDLDWTYLSPPAEFDPGTRTGIFRTGIDQLLVDADGKSHISMEDYAIAVLDELETPAHIRKRYTVGY